MGSLSADDSLVWKKSGANETYSRGLDSTEAHFKGMGSAGKPYGREFGFLSIILKLSFGGVDDPVRACREAWTNLSRHHPLLASFIDGDQRIYRVQTPEETETWLKETFLVHSSSDSYQTAEQLRLALRPVKRAQLHFLPESGEILLHVGHDVMDGQAMLSAVNMLLDEISNPTRKPMSVEETLARLPPPLVVASNSPPTTKGHEDQVQKALQDWFAALPWLTLRSRNFDKDPGDTKARRKTLSKEETTAVITAAKSKGFTPTHVVEAAAIMALKAMDPQSENKKYGSCGIFSLRQQCESQWRQCVSPYLMIFPLVVSPTTFEDTAKQLKSYYQGRRAETQTLLSLVQPTYQAFASFPHPPPGSNQMISLSSLGRFEPFLDSQHGQVKLEDLWLMYETPNAVVNSFLWTKEGCLSWQVVYNEVYYPEETILTWIETTKDILFKGLGI